MSQLGRSLFVPPWGMIFLTLLLVDTEDNDNLVTSDTNELLDTANTSAGKFGQQDHSVDVIVFEKLHVCAHLGNLTQPRIVSSK